jgi:hypothetical protein
VAIQKDRDFSNQISSASYLIPLHKGSFTRPISEADFALTLFIFENRFVKKRTSLMQNQT